MGHSEVAETPGQRGHDGQRCVVAGCAAYHIMHLCHAQISGQITGVGKHRIPAAGHLDAKNNDNKKGDGHDDGLNKVCGAGCKKSAESRVNDDDERTNQHRRHVRRIKQSAEELSASGESGRSIGNKENDNDNRCDSSQKIFLVPIPFGEKLRQRNSITLLAVTTNSSCNEKPV